MLFQFLEHVDAIEMCSLRFLIHSSALLLLMFSHVTLVYVF